MPPYPRKKDLPPQNNLLTPVTGAAGQVVSYTPFMLYVCQQRKLLEQKKNENFNSSSIKSMFENNNQINDKDFNLSENNARIQDNSQKYNMLLNNNFNLGLKFSIGWNELEDVEKDMFTQAAGTERIRRRLQRIYAKSWVESAKQTRESNAITSPDVMLRLHEMDQESRSKRNQLLKFNSGSKYAKFSNSAKKNKMSHKRKISPKLKRKEIPKGPQKPRNPVSAFQFYTRDVRDSFREKNPGINGSELGKMISNKWKEKSTIERSAYVEKQNEDKIRFAKEVEVFVAKHPEFAEKYEKKKRKKGSPTGNGNPNKKSKSGNNGSSSSSGKNKGNDDTNKYYMDQFARMHDSNDVSMVDQNKILEASGKGTSIIKASMQT